MAENQITVPEELRDQVQEFSIRANSFDIAKRDYQVEVGKTLQGLLKYCNKQDKLIADLNKEIVELKKQIPVSPEQPKETPK